MKGEWIQAASGTWHLVWDRDEQLVGPEEVGTWCAKIFKFDDPRKPSEQIVGYEDILHDECLRKSEELE